MVQSKGAIVDTGAFSLTIAQVLQHDATLGATAEGGFAKNGTGSLTLTGREHIYGATVINSGTVVAGNVHALGTAGVVIHSGGTLVLQSGLTSGMVVPSVTFDGGPGSWLGALDMTNDKLIVEATVSHATSVANLQSQAHGVITSSTMGPGFGIAVMDNGSLATPFATFGGQAVDGNSI